MCDDSIALDDDGVGVGWWQEFPVIIQEVITDANAALLKAPLAIPLHLQAPYDIAEVRYGLTQTPTVGQGPSGGFAGLQVRALALLTQPQSTDRPVQLVAKCCLVADPWPWELSTLWG